MSSVTVISEGQTIVVPREVHTAGGDATRAYVEAALGSGKPLSKMNRGDLDAAALAAGIDPTQYDTATKLRDALKDARPAEGVE